MSSSVAPSAGTPNSRKAARTAATGEGSPDGKLCNACHEHLPRSEFPKRQWSKKHRRCIYCISRSAPFLRPSKKDHAISEVQQHENQQPAESIFEQRAKTEKEARLSELEHTLEEAAKNRVPSSPSNSTMHTERSDEFSGEDVSHTGTLEQSERLSSSLNTKEDSSQEYLDAHSSISSPDFIPDEIHQTLPEESSQGASDAVEAIEETPPEEPTTDPPVSLEDDIASLARNWTPPVQDVPPARVAPPSSAPPVPPSESGSSENGNSRWRDILMLFASPVLDETGSAQSVVAGIFSLFLVGAFIGLVSEKNPMLPTPWYRFVSAVIGYIYFLCWSISFYPQVISNFKRKSTHGLSADFCALNVVGFACYTAYNVSLFWSPTIRELYREKYGSEVTVQSNDVAFAVHALLLSSVTLGQIVIYRDAQRPSKVIIWVILLVLILCLIYPVLVLSKKYTWLDYLYVLSFAKIGISLIKYIPQVMLNHRRKSTMGWSIWNILLDFTGGVLSDLQLVLDCADLGDFSGITGNLAKFGLGSISIIFDILFMMQHYILYPENRRQVAGRPETEPLLSEGDETSVV